MKTSMDIDGTTCFVVLIALVRGVFPVSWSALTA